MKRRFARLLLMSCGLYSANLTPMNPTNFSVRRYGLNKPATGYSSANTEEVVQAILATLREVNVTITMPKGETEQLRDLIKDYIYAVYGMTKYLLYEEGASEEIGKQFAAGAMKSLTTSGQLAALEARINRFADQTIHRNLAAAGAIFTGVVGACFLLRYSIPVLVEMARRAYTQPKLIIESTQKSALQRFTALFKSPPTPHKPAEMVFSPSLKKQLDDIVKITKAINKKIQLGKTNVKYRNLMLYGPPGTGKTMFAKELAKQSGLEYAFMSGSSFSKFKGGEGIEALDELFAWAKKSKGLMIFIDEAETFLSKREKMDPQSKAYQLLNNFLNYTSARSSEFMLVFATNHHDALDSAMYRRIDDLIEMPLPSKEQRANTLRLYKNTILMDKKQNGKKFVASVEQHLGNEVIDAIAEKTKGLSYGELEGIINTIKTDADILDPALVTPEVINTVVARAIEKHLTFTGGTSLGAVEN